VKFFIKLSLMSTVIFSLFTMALGQEILFSQEDPANDDYGPGWYNYPRSEVFNPGAFDILSVEISTDYSFLIVKIAISGILRNPWTAPNGFSVQMIDFYLDTAPGGSTETIFDTSIPSNLTKNPQGKINAIIASDAAWEFAFRIHGWVGDMFIPMSMEPIITAIVSNPPYATNVAFQLPPAPADAPRYAKYENVASVLADPVERTITFKIPLKIIGNPGTNPKFVLYMHSVDWGNARLVMASKGDWVFGGGEDDDSDPNIIDMLGPQEEILNYKRGSPVTLPGLSLAPWPFPPEPVPSSHYLTSEEYALLAEIFRVHMNYFLSPEVVTAFGFPLTAYKVGDRARFGYSNPTEWGYTWQAWIAAAERGIISRDEAICRLKRALTVLEALQHPEESYQGLPYPFYKMTTPDGKDLCTPYHDPHPEIPSGDNALLYASLLIIEGWGRWIGDVGLWTQAERIRKRMNFRVFLQEEGDCLYLVHTINANTGKPSSARWNIFADEGGVVAWIAYVSGSISFEEYKKITECQYRSSAHWTSCTGKEYVVEEAAWFNAMFTWAVRSLAGFPIGSFDAPEGTKSNYSKQSFVPAVQAQLAYGDCLGIDHPAFSDAMSQARNGQGLVGWVQNWFIPPNLIGFVGTAPTDIVPHALFVPFNALPDLPIETKDRLIAEIIELQKDKAMYYHDSGPYPFGFEVIASPYKDDVNYVGADDGRNIFETLSHAYIVLSLFNALQLNDGKPTFCAFAAKVPNYTEMLRKVLLFLYP
jgi:hypothetical protein